MAGRCTIARRPWTRGRESSPVSAIILASSSPYRKALLSRLMRPFETLSPQVDETPYAGETPRAIVKRLARAKAQAAAAGRRDALIIGSDQCAVRGGIMLGKPGDFETAFSQLKDAAGGCVLFHTGLCVLNTATGETQIDEVPTAVRFRALSDAQIATYLRKEAPYQCAGSFMSEGLGIALIERIEGEDPSALIGLPLIRLVDMLAHAGLDVLS
jgi:septum formation protein